MKSMLKRSGRLAGVALLTLLFSFYPENGVRAGDSVYGKVTAVERVDLVVLDYGAGSYRIRLVGIEVPQDQATAEEAKQFVSRMLLNKNARLRFDGRTPEGEMVGKIYTDDPEIGIKDVGLETVRTGLVVRQPSYRGYPYGEMAAAEDEARQARRGLWSQFPNR
jgi:endonuclease YncB( thermonuclease family)